VLVPDDLIEQLQERTDPSNAELVSNLPQVGDQLEVIEGPFRGLNAVFSQIDGDPRALVLIKLLNQQVEASIPLSNLSAKDQSSDKS
jgi:transcriptional antiterminator RfaH